MSTITVTRPESAAEERYYVATQWQLIRRRFMAHRLALLGIVVLVVLYAGALFAEFVAPYDGFRRFADYQLAAPQRVRLFHDGRPVLRPFVYGLHRERHPETLRWQFTIDRDARYPIALFVRGDPYRLVGLIPADIHLFGVRHQDGFLFLFGTDNLGRDLFSRNVYAARISLSIGLVGVAMSFVLGCLLWRHLGLLRRRPGHLHPAPDRIPDFDSVDPAVDRAGGGTAQRLATAAHLLRHHPDPVGGGLDRTGARGARQAAGIARGRLRDGGAHRRRRRAAHHHAPPAAVVHELPDRQPHLEHPRHDPRRDRAQLPGRGHSAARDQLGSAAAGRPERAHRGPGITVLSFNFVGDGLRDAADPYR